MCAPPRARPGRGPPPSARAPRRRGRRARGARRSPRRPRAGGRSPSARDWRSRPESSAVSVMHGCFGSGRVEEVFDVPDAVDLPRPIDEGVDQVLLRELAPQLDDSLLCVHVHRALHLVLVAEELALHLVLERGVVVLLRPGLRDQSPQPPERDASTPAEEEPCRETRGRRHRQELSHLYPLVVVETHLPQASGCSNTLTSPGAVPARATRRSRRSAASRPPPRRPLRPA